MILNQQVCAQALLLAGEMEPRQEEMLKLLCNGAVSALQKRLREGLRPEDCLTDFIASASLYALAAMSTQTDMGRLDRITAGDITLQRSGTDAAVNCLRYQAEVMMAPYLKDSFSFRGV
jgi:hypothetical protein